MHYHGRPLNRHHDAHAPADLHQDPQGARHQADRRVEARFEIVEHRDEVEPAEHRHDDHRDEHQAAENGQRALPNVRFPNYADGRLILASNFLRGNMLLE